MKSFFAVVLTFFTLLMPGDVSAATLAETLSGRILLQVESHGEAWYVDPLELRRYYLGRPDDAWYLMRTKALGITNANLAKIPTDTQSFTGDLALRRRLSGRILLQVESHGEAWYVDPVTLKRAYLGRPTDAFNIMRRYGLGITNVNLSRIPTINYQQPTTIISGVPFTAQAPFGEWEDSRQQEGCEEASVIMAVKWARGELLTLSEAKSLILDMSDWENETYGTYYDTSIDDTAERLFKEYFDFTDVEVKKNIGVEDIKAELQSGRIVLIAVNGQELHNPYFSGAGPLRHMIVVTGFDAATNEFVTHDPGTRSGADYRYTASTIASALRDYPTGNHAPITPMPTALISVVKE